MAPHDLAAARGVVAALHEQRLEPSARERERAEEPRAAGAHHHGPQGRRARDDLGEAVRLLVHDPHVLLGAVPGEAAQERPLGVLAARELATQREGEMHLAALAGVDRAAPARDGREVLLAYAQAACQRAAARGELGGVGPVELLKPNADA